VDDQAVRRESLAQCRGETLSVLEYVALADAALQAGGGE
jgi:hypothetical protein